MTTVTQPLILAVDDEASNLQLLRQILQDHFRLRFAKDGPRALELAREETPDLILLDVMMPGMSGYEVCAALKADPALAAVPVIFVTALNDTSDEVEGFEAGAVDYITKPVSPPIVRARVRTHLSLVRMEELRASRLLLKPGPLDPDEWKIMQGHAHIGAEIIGQHDHGVLGLARNIALTHHEKWDGSGYPNGLAGKDIPLEGRICAIADVFDALTSIRPYKKAWTEGEALDFLVKQKGKHFDPVLVDLFLAQMPAIRAIRERWAEQDEVPAAPMQVAA